MNLCAQCGKAVSEYKIIKINSLEYYICEKCLPIFIKCDDCGEYMSSAYAAYTPFDDATKTYGTKRRVCRKCWNNKRARYSSCSGSCGRTVDITNEKSYVLLHRDVVAKFCLHCAKDMIAPCPTCGENTYKTYIERVNETIMACEVCRKDMSPERHINQYSFKPNPLFHMTKEERLGSEMDKHVLDYTSDTSKHLFLGIELEIDDGLWGGKLAKQIKNNWPIVYCKKDRSLTSQGIEIVSYPATLSYHKHELGWERICKLCRDMKYKSGDTQRSSGVHIHFNRSFIGKSHEVFQLKLASFVHMHPNYIQRIAGRTNQDYARMMTARKVSDLKGITDSHNRHDAVNFTNPNTIEVRIFKGSLDPDTLKGYLEIVDGMVRFLKTASSTSVLKTDSCWKAYCQYLAKSGYNYAKKHMETVNAWRV